MKINENAKLVLEKRYLEKNDKGEVIETIDGLFSRVANAVAEADVFFDKEADVSKTRAEFYEMMTGLDFLPNSPTLMNAGRPLGQLSACFVLPIEDSMEGIFDAIKQAALIHKSGGGTGFSFSRIRPSGAVVKTTGGVASGPVSFMRVFNMATEAVKQGGTRRGANMGILRVDHPDILSFIDCKKDNADITNFNISVGITESFMQAVETDSLYSLINPKTKEVVKKINSRDVFEKIVEGAWRNGEPGIIFLDRLNRDNVVPCAGELESTNPCGEQPLLPYESCNLGSINLVNMLVKTEIGYELSLSKITETVKKAVHFLDNVIEVNNYPLKEIDYNTKQTRKIGLGVMGFADMLLHLGIPYNSYEAIELAKTIMQHINEEGKKASIKLAEIRGAFPLFQESTLAQGKPIRNATITTIAPTGTLSIIAGVSSGVEPIFGYAYIRNVMDNTELLEVNPVLKRTLMNRGLYTEQLMMSISKEGSLAHIDEIPDDIKKVFVASHDISPEYHIKMQAAFQQYTDNAVSKTINFPNAASKHEVFEAYMLAYKLGCKGVTIYRDGSRDSQVLNIGKVNKAVTAVGNEQVVAMVVAPRPRPAITMGLTEKVQIACGSLYVTVNYDENGICDVFTSTGKVSGCAAQSESTARLASIALRSGVSVEKILEQLECINCPSNNIMSSTCAVSCPFAMASVIRKVYALQKDSKKGSLSQKVVQAFEENKIEATINDKMYKFCPECGSQLEHSDGCIICRNCGYGKCS